jgi:hypothetical protein
MAKCSALNLMVSATDADRQVLAFLTYRTKYPKLVVLYHSWST